MLSQKRKDKTQLTLGKIQRAFDTFDQQNNGICAGIYYINQINVL